MTLISQVKTVLVVVDVLEMSDTPMSKIFDLIMRFCWQGESKARFVERVQSMIAEELGVPILDISIQQKRALLQSALQAKNSCGRRS